MEPKQIPILPSSDFDATTAFYVLLGFTEIDRFGDHYLLLEHTIGMELHFYCAGKVKPKSNDHAAYIRFETDDEANALHTRWNGITNTPGFARVAGKVGRLTSISYTDYGLREFALLDLDGNLLRIGGRISVE
ncbi:MAG: catechol 2,3-dioxygenase-like lactoylglutathione lyase family enzyme [Verrucomicrobiales bacterium]|jgi:catechol 2,3-dioxygenase-like lactoylglutathione lyase family enzyme